MIAHNSYSILLVSRHGLGDCAQLLLLIANLRHYRPDLRIGIACGRGKHSLFHGTVDVVYSLDDDQVPQADFDEVYDLDWWECRQSYADCPSTKTSQCLKDVFGLDPLSLPAEIAIQPESRERVDDYLTTLPTKDFVCLHVNGNTSAGSKDIDRPTVKRLCDLFLLNEITPVILDWDQRSPLPDNRRIFCPNARHPLWRGYGTGDGNTLAALLSRARLVVAVDSGPGHVAQFCRVPTLMVWTGHHPLHYCDRVGNVLHLISQNHSRFLRGDQTTGLKFFRDHYRHTIYNNLAADLCREIGSMLNLSRELETPFMSLSSTAYAEDYYYEHQRAGLDYLFHGDWQISYGKWLVDGLDLRGKMVLDVGCACGSIACGLAEAGSIVHGIDLSNHMIHLGKGRFGGRVTTLNVMDAVNLHHFPDGSLDCVHATQTFEHFKPELVPFILREFHRVLRPGGLLFTIHDTVESFAREGRRLGKNGEENGDPTHVCIWDHNTWNQAFENAGFFDISDLHRAQLFEDPTSFPQRWGYKWDWWLLRSKN